MSPPALCKYSNISLFGGTSLLYVAVTVVGVAASRVARGRIKDDKWKHNRGLYTEYVVSFSPSFSRFCCAGVQVKH